MVTSAIAGAYAYPVFVDQFETKKLKLNVFVQGNLEEHKVKPVNSPKLIKFEKNNLNSKVFLTVHDIGKSHEAFIDFFNTERMKWAHDNCIVIHVCVPGQEPGAEDFNEE